MEEETQKNLEPEKKEERTGTKRLVGVRFSSAGKVYSFSAEDYDIAIHDLVVVEGDKGPIIGKVTDPVYEKPTKEVATNIRKVVRKANAEDVERYQKNREEAMAAFELCKKKIVEHGLSMKLVDVDVLTGDAKAIFYFTAEERVDFRGLVKDMATALHKRIEMRQIGARDAAKSIGSTSSCGLICCCERHLREFKSIAIQMAKNQGLSPNPTKLTGMCGKLKCCLIYENEMYSEFKKGLPNIGKEVETPKGQGFVTNRDIPRQIVYVRLEGQDKEVKFKLDEIRVVKKGEGRKETRAKAKAEVEAKDKVEDKDRVKKKRR